MLFQFLRFAVADLVIVVLDIADLATVDLAMDLAIGGFLVLGDTADIEEGGSEVFPDVGTNNLVVA